MTVALQNIAVSPYDDSLLQDEHSFFSWPQRGFLEELSLEARVSEKKVEFLDRRLSSENSFGSIPMLSFVWQTPQKV